MKINQTFTDSRGDLWTIAGYTNPREMRHGGDYRLIRMRDGARIRVRSNKFCGLDVGRDRIERETNVPDDYNEVVLGNGAKKLSDDHLAVGYLSGRVG